MPSYTIYEDMCCASVDEVQALNRTSLVNNVEYKKTMSVQNYPSSSKSFMSHSSSTNNFSNNQQTTNNTGKIMSSTTKQQQNIKGMGYVDLNIHPHLLTCGPNKENIDPLTGNIYPLSSSIFNNTKSNSKCTTNLIRDPLKDITLSVLGQTPQQQPKSLKKLSSSSSLQNMLTPRKNKLRGVSSSTGSLNPLSPSTLYLR